MKCKGENVGGAPCITCMSMVSAEKGYAFELSILHIRMLHKL